MHSQHWMYSSIVPLIATMYKKNQGTTYVALHEGYGVHRTHQDGSAFMWYQPCQRRKYTILVNIFLKMCDKKLVIHTE